VPDKDPLDFFVPVVVLALVVFGILALIAWVLV
jgi:hypothetical protein